MSEPSFFLGSITLLKIKNLNSLFIQFKCLTNEFKCQTVDLLTYTHKTSSYPWMGKTENASFSFDALTYFTSKFFLVPLELANVDCSLLKLD